MNITASPKVLIGAGVAMAALVTAGAFVVSGTEKQARVFYEQAKTDMGIDDYLSEGKVSYSLLSNKLVIEEPELRIVPGTSSIGEEFLNSFLSTMGVAAYRMAGRDVNQKMGQYYYTIFDNQVPDDAILSMSAEEIRLGYDGDKNDGSLDIEIKGISLGQPFMAKIADALVEPSEVADEIQPKTTAKVTDYGFETGSDNHKWRPNMVNQLPWVGNWVINATGVFGATVDAHLVAERDESGEGTLTLTLTHRLDGDQIGQIKRVAEFEDMPDLEYLGKALTNGATAFHLANVGSDEISAIALTKIVEGFARNAKVRSYELQYSDYDLLKSAFEQTGLKDSKASMALFCSQYKVSQASMLKHRKIDDSECGVAQKLITDGEYRESYEFSEGKALFAELMVNDKYEVKIE